MALFSLWREIEYLDHIARRVYRARPFWISPDGQKALAIPEIQRPFISKRDWKPFDAEENYWHLFNFGPVAPKMMEDLIDPETPPFFIHSLHSAKTRAKFGDGHSYGQTSSYFYYGMGANGTFRWPSWTLCHQPWIVEALPVQYRKLWDRTLEISNRWNSKPAQL